MNYKQKLLELKETQYVSGGYPETMAAGQRITDQLISELVGLDQTSPFLQKLDVFLQCQKKLNTLMMAEDVRADTVERDIFYNVLEKIGAIVGMNACPEDAIKFIEVLDSDEEVS